MIQKIRIHSSVIIDSYAIRLKWALSKSRILNILADSKVLLSTLIFSYTFLMTYFSYLRFQNFFATNWDLGINMQLLWTTTHGHLMFETGDFEFNGILSFLQLHSTYIAFPIAFIYNMMPTPQFLFTLQSLVLSCSIIPLFLIGRHIGVSRKILFPALVVYLLNFGIVSGLMYDFHWETFLPLEFFGMFYLLLRRKYALSVVPFIIGCSTLEVFPFLAAGGILYFIVERIPIARFGNWTKEKVREALELSVYLFSTVVSYVLIRILQLSIVPKLIGQETHLASVSSSVTSLFVINISLVILPHSLLYWLLLYSAFGYISVFYPKHVILAIPWMFNTFLLFPSFASYFGNQYAIIASIPIAVGFIYGLKELHKIDIHHPQFVVVIVLFVTIFSLTVFSLLSADSRLLLSFRNASSILILDILIALPILSLLIPVFRGKHSDNQINQHGNHELRRQYRSLNFNRQFKCICILFTMLLVFNFMMSPLNTKNFEATPMPGYQFKDSINPEFKFVHYLVSKIDPHSSVVASDNLFPFVANNPNAYAITWFPFNASQTPFFPFNMSHFPDFVLADSSQFFLMPSFLSAAVFNSSDYGLIEYINFNQYPGSIYLFEFHTHQATKYHNVSTQPNQLYFYSKNLAVGPSGRIAPYKDSMFGSVIQSDPTNNLSGNSHTIWYGPYFTFEPGYYKVIISLRGGTYKKSSNNLPVLYMNSNGFRSQTYYSLNVYSSQLSSQTWTTFSFLIQINEPYPLTEFRGYLGYNDSGAYGWVMLNYIEVFYLHSP